MQTARPVTKPSKQRKMLYQAPDHIRHRLLAAHLSPQLRATHIVKSLPVRSGDTVRVMRGDHKGFEGKISRVNLKKYRIYVEGLTREKVDGTTISVPLHPSKVLVIHLNLDDKWRKKILDRKKKAYKKPKKVAEKPKAKLEEKPPELVEKEVVEEKVVEEEKAAIEEKMPVEEKPVAEKKPAKKRVTRGKRKAVKETVPEKAEAKVEEPKKQMKRKPKTEKKALKRKTAKKTEERGE